MSKFQEISFDGKCDVCGKETKVVDCASSSMGAISYKYCEECLQKELLGKTEEEFIVEYNKINEEKYRWYKGYGRILWMRWVDNQTNILNNCKERRIKWVIKQKIILF